MNISNIYRAWPQEEPEPWANIWIEAAGFRDGHLCNAVQPSFYCVHLVKKGTINYTYGHIHKTTLEPGSIFLSWQGIPYTFRATLHKKCGATLISWIRLFGPKIESFLNGLGLSHEQPFNKARNPKEVHQIITKLVDLAEQYTKESNMHAAVMLHKLALACGYSSLRNPSDTPLASKAMAVMKEEANIGMNIEQLSDAFKVSRWTLYHSFKNELGCSPMDALMEIRFNHAKKLLKTSDHSITEVATMSGFSDPSYFGRVLRKRTGKSPKQFRENGGQ